MVCNNMDMQLFAPFAVYLAFLVSSKCPNNRSCQFVALFPLVSSVLSHEEGAQSSIFVV